MSSVLTDILNGLEQRHGLAVVALGLEASRARATELEGDMNDPGFWSDQDAARKLSQELAELNREIDAWDKMKTDLIEAKDIAAFAEEGTAEDRSEAGRIVAELEIRFAAM